MEEENTTKNKLVQILNENMANLTREVEKNSRKYKKIKSRMHKMKQNAENRVICRDTGLHTRGREGGTIESQISTHEGTKETLASENDN